jgi:hypothetical protein
MWQDGVDLLEDQVSGSDDALSLERLSHYPFFGRTIGASSSILSCLSEINHLSRELTQTGFDGRADSPLLNFKQMLVFEPSCNLLEAGGDNYVDDACVDLLDIEQKAQEMHLRAFEAATVIYYHQVSENATPEYLAPYVQAVLQYVSTFLRLCGGNYTLWPAFIAGVEAYSDSDMNKFSVLFENATSIGMRNRRKAREVMEQVWLIRSSIAAQTGQNPGEVRVNWRHIMRGLDIDVLLV